MTNKFDTAITADMTAKQVREAVRQTTLKYGRRGGLIQHVKIEQGWLVAVIYNCGGYYEHWNFHPGRKELTMTHTSVGQINTAESLDTSIAALERLYV